MAPSTAAAAAGTCASVSSCVAESTTTQWCICASGGLLLLYAVVIFLQNRSRPGGKRIAAIRVSEPNSSVHQEYDARFAIDPPPNRAAGRLVVAAVSGLRGGLRPGAARLHPRKLRPHAGAVLRAGARWGAHLLRRGPRALGAGLPRATPAEVS